MLWVETNLRRESSIVWCEEGLDAPLIKIITYKSYMVETYK